MPTYEYRCKRCSYEFEAFQSILSEPIENCPRCKGKVERLISGGSGIIFKGTGFYETDYKKKSGGNGKHYKPTETVTEEKEPAVTATEKKPAKKEVAQK
jgi:putative FmdB family regulatory protein